MMTPSRDSTDPTPDPRIEAAAKALYEGGDQFGRKSQVTWEDMLTYGGHSPGNTHHPLADEWRRMAKSALEAADRVSEPEGERIEITDEMVAAAVYVYEVYEGYGPGAMPPAVARRILRAALDALGPMVPLARAQELERERESFGRLASAWQARHDEMERLAARQSERAERAEEAAQAFAATLAHIAEEDGDCPWAEREAAEALAHHPGFLPADEATEKS